MINFILSGLFEDFNGLDTNRDEQHLFCLDTGSNITFEEKLTLPDVTSSP